MKIYDDYNEYEEIERQLGIRRGLQDELDSVISRRGEVIESHQVLPVCERCYQFPVINGRCVGLCHERMRD